MNYLILAEIRGFENRGNGIAGDEGTPKNRCQESCKVKSERLKRMTVMPEDQDRISGSSRTQERGEPGRKQNGERIDCVNVQRQLRSGNVSPGR
jgi:hypothetical protein